MHCHFAVRRMYKTENSIINQLKPNSITLAGSKLVADKLRTSQRNGIWLLSVIIRPHRSTTCMYVDAGYSYRPSSVVCQSVTLVSPAKRLNRLRCCLGCWLGWVGHWGAHWRHLANTAEPSMCGGDAACCQITLTTYSVMLSPNLFFGTSDKNDGAPRASFGNEWRVERLLYALFRGLLRNVIARASLLFSSVWICREMGSPWFDGEMLFRMHLRLKTD